MMFPPATVKQWLSQKKKEGDPGHPWFDGFQTPTISLPDHLSGRPLREIQSRPDLAEPILFMARGHSGTRALAKMLELAGVFMGSHDDQDSLNDTYDSLYWTYGFQRTLVPKLFQPGVGCMVDEHTVMAVAAECLSRHLRGYAGGPWGFKTCEGMFSHALYQYVFPRAKYIYLVRNGKDVILSGNGYLTLTNPSSRVQHWSYFKLLAFGISNDLAVCPFHFPERPEPDDAVMRHRFWVQAKSWREHVRMVEHLREKGELSESVHTIRYEDLCRDPDAVLDRLFRFLEVEFPSRVREMARGHFHPESIDRWRNFASHISNCGENMGRVFDSMSPELALLGYAA